MFRYNIRPDSDIPIYRQLVDQINAEIRSGALKVGTQLPTVREMASLLNLSCGTVKRVYDRLQEMGDIEMTRRRGTFVKYVRSDTDSRKLQAMTAIDRMIRQLSDLNFSPAEIHIFVSLKMREWGLKWSGIRIAVISDYVDFAPIFEEQLAAFGNVTVQVWTPKQVREYPYNLDEQSDVILASPEDTQKLAAVLHDSEKLIKIAFTTRSRDLFRLAGFTDSPVCVLSQDRSFLHLIRSLLPEELHASLCHAWPSKISGDEYRMYILPSASNEQMEDNNIPASHRITVEHIIDGGSMIYLEERISRIREERQMQPGGLHINALPPHLE